MTQDIFIKRVIKKFGDKFGTSKISYKTNNEEIDIICPEHGVVNVIPSIFLKDGCPLCKKEKSINIKRNKFIQKAIQIHGDKYDYSKVEYKGTTAPVTIICPEHGGFWQKANSHTSRKYGCPKCSENKNKKLGYEIGINSLKKNKRRNFIVI